jgi:hypothetical protein
MNSRSFVEIFSLTPRFNAVTGSLAESKTVSNGFAHGPRFAPG